jgi:alanine dehydrogenase
LLLVTAVENVQECIAGVDIICGVTSTKEPIVKGQWLEPGQHINAVGACTPVTREFDSLAISKCRLFCDSKVSVQNEAGEILTALREGLIQEDHLLGEIGELLDPNSNLIGRQNPSDITCFKSLGIAVEDLACAEFIYNKALSDSTAKFINWE